MEQVTEFIPELIDVAIESKITPMKRYHQLMEKIVVVAELLQAMLLYVLNNNCFHDRYESLFAHTFLTCHILSQV